MPSLDSLAAFVQPFVTNGAIPTTLVVGFLLTLFSKYIARGSGRTLGLTIATLWSLALVTGFTLRLGDANVTAEYIWFLDPVLWADSVVVGANWILNAVLFVPAGFSLAMFLRSPIRAALTLSLASFMIETVQQITSVGIPDPSDFVANTSGAMIGSLIAVVLLAVRRFSRR
ncbi:MAG: VanZ like family [Actinomycetota bacterium]|jgi:glycopeptide antibiotics resistance protein